MKKIDKVVITNFKKFEALTVEMKGRHLLLIGMNGAGKSTILDAIKRTLGQKATLEEPVRIGADSAKIRTYLFDDNKKYILEEKFSARTGKSRMRFYAINGGHEDELSSPMERFHQIFGMPIDFTPLIDMSGEKQFEYLKENIGVDLSMYEHNYEAVFDDRTLINRELKTIMAKLNAPELRVVDADIATYTEEKKVDEILAKREDIMPLMNQLAEADRRDQNIQKVLDKQTEITREIERLKSLILLQEGAYQDCAKWIEEHPVIEKAPIQADIDAKKLINEQVEEELKTISQWNEMYVKVKNFVAAKKELEEKNQKSQELTQKLESIEADLRAAICEINLSNIVPDLQLVYEVGPDPKKEGKTKVIKCGLEFEGLPFSRAQHSYGKLLKAIIKLSAYFNAGKLNFISIGDWNLLDEMSQKEVLDFALENPDLEIQFAIEKVDNHRELITEIYEEQPVKEKPAKEKVK